MVSKKTNCAGNIDIRPTKTTPHTSYVTLNFKQTLYLYHLANEVGLNLVSKEMPY